MHRFFLLSTPLTVGSTVDLSPLANQLFNVLRLQTGDSLILLDNRGDEFITRIEQADRRHLSGRVLEQRPCLAEPTLHLTLYQCTLKADKFEWVLQKGTELGVSRFVPVISERSVVRPASALLPKYDRWRAIVREAAEQCGRGQIPELAEPIGWQQAVSNAQGVKLLAWEETGSDWEIGRLNLSISQSPNLLIGPEGGVSQAEAKLAVENGWQLLSLGKRILRAETAAIAAIAVLMAEWESVFTP